MNLNRNYDIVTNSEDLEHIYTFRNFPTFGGCTSADIETDRLADMSFWISRRSGMIQLNPLLPLDVVYENSHGSGSIGILWHKHHKAFAEFIERYDPKSVFEIGGSHGILSKNYHSKKDIPWTLIDPNPELVDGCKAESIKGYFDENFVFSGEFDTVVHSHVFEHIYNPQSFIENISNFLKVGDRMIFSIPNLKVCLQRKYTNCLNFEHTMYLSEEYVEYFLAKYGFKILDREYFLDDHSIFYSTIKDTPGSTILSDDLYGTNKQIFQNYIDFHLDLVYNINQHMVDDGDYFLFGASNQSQYLINFGLNDSKISCILDNDTLKQGKRLYGTDKYVKSPSILKDLKSPKVIVRAGPYTNEVVQQLKQINPTTEFIL